MEIKITLDAPKGWTRRALLYVATPLALVGVTAAIASAGPMNPIDTSWIAAPNKISAALLKANLDDLQIQLSSASPIRRNRTPGREVFRAAAIT
jgi:hypothetical protein